MKNSKRILFYIGTMIPEDALDFEKKNITPTKNCRGTEQSIFSLAKELSKKCEKVDIIIKFPDKFRDTIYLDFFDDDYNLIRLVNFDQLAFGIFSIKTPNVIIFYRVSPDENIENLENMAFFTDPKIKKIFWLNDFFSFEYFENGLTQKNVDKFVDFLFEDNYTVFSSYRHRQQLDTIIQSFKSNNKTKFVRNKMNVIPYGIDIGNRNIKKDQIKVDYENRKINFVATNHVDRSIRTIYYLFPYLAKKIKEKYNFDLTLDFYCIDDTLKKSLEEYDGVNYDPNYLDEINNKKNYWKIYFVNTINLIYDIQKRRDKFSSINLKETKCREDIFEDYENGKYAFLFYISDDIKFYETFCASVVEAQVFGIPTITKSGLDAVTENVIQNSNQLQIKYGTIFEEQYQKIEKYLDLGNKNWFENYKNNSEDIFKKSKFKFKNWDKISDEWIKLFGD